MVFGPVSEEFAFFLKEFVGDDSFDLRRCRPLTHQPRRPQALQRPRDGKLRQLRDRCTKRFQRCRIASKDLRNDGGGGHEPGILRLGL